MRATLGSRLLHWPGHGWLALPVRLYLGWVFLTACWHKVLHPATFALDVATYQFLPLELINLFAITLPWVELAAGVMLVVGLRARAASLLTGAMMVAFIVALIAALDKGLQMGCGCFASNALAEEDPISWLTVMRDLAWLAMSLYILFLDQSPLGFDRWFERRRRRSPKEVS